MAWINLFCCIININIILWGSSLMWGLAKPKWFCLASFSVNTCPVRITGVQFRDYMLHTHISEGHKETYCYIWWFLEIKPHQNYQLVSHFTGQSVMLSSSFARQWVSSFMCFVDWNGGNGICSLFQQGSCRLSHLRL